jgi:large subunit ribosomal protein L18
MAGKTLASASSLSMKLSKEKPMDKAKKVGQEIAKKIKAKKITEIAFDKNGYKYHGNVKALAEAVREEESIQF